jgi:hypothetical protein
MKLNQMRPLPDYYIRSYFCCKSAQNTHVLLVHSAFSLFSASSELRSLHRAKVSIYKKLISHEAYFPNHSYAAPVSEQRLQKQPKLV